MSKIINKERIGRKIPKGSILFIATEEVKKGWC